jgi:hypothetical protein
MFSRLLITLSFLILLVACSSEVTDPTASPSSIPATNPAIPTEEEHASPVPPKVSPTTTDSPATQEPTSTVKVETVTPVEESVDLFFDSPEYGVQAFMWWHNKGTIRELTDIQELDFGWVKQSFPWRDIEAIEKGHYDWYRPDRIVKKVEDSGLKLLVRIDRQPFWSQENDWPPLENAPPADLQDFADFCGDLAKRYKGRIDAYQIWNEPNLSREWGEEPPDPAEYTELLKVCYQEIKAADPEAIVISAGLAPTGTGLPLAIPDDDFLQSMYDAGAGDYFDVLGLNAPGYKAPPEASPEEGENNPDYGGGRWFVFRHVEDMRAIMEANGDADKQVAVLELGWTTDTQNPEYSWHAVTEEEQADYLARAYQYASENWQPWMGPIFTIYIADRDWTPEGNEQWWWAITLPDGSKRPAFDALREMEKQNTDNGAGDAVSQ